MKFDKNLAALLALCAVLLILAYVASQKGQQNPAQNNANITNKSQARHENATIAKPANQTPGQAPEGNVSNQTQAPTRNITGLGTGQTPPGSTPNLTNVSDITIIPPPPPPPLENMSGLVESDFMVVDDSMPSLLTSQQLIELPPPPGDNTG